MVVRGGRREQVAASFKQNADRPASEERGAGIMLNFQYAVAERSTEDNLAARALALLDQPRRHNKSFQIRPDRRAGD